MIDSLEYQTNELHTSQDVPNNPLNSSLNNDENECDGLRPAPFMGFRTRKLSRFKKPTCSISGIINEPETTFIDGIKFVSHNLPNNCKSSDINALMHEYQNYEADSDENGNLVFSSKCQNPSKVKGRTKRIYNKRNRKLDHPNYSNSYVYGLYSYCDELQLMKDPLKLITGVQIHEIDDVFLRLSIDSKKIAPDVFSEWKTVCESEAKLCVTAVLKVKREDIHVKKIPVASTSDSLIAVSALAPKCKRPWSRRTYQYKHKLRKNIPELDVTTKTRRVSKLPARFRDQEFHVQLPNTPISNYFVDTAELIDGGLPKSTNETPGKENSCFCKTDVHFCQSLSKIPARKRGRPPKITHVNVTENQHQLEARSCNSRPASYVTKRGRPKKIRTMEFINVNDIKKMNKSTPMSANTKKYGLFRKGDCHEQTIYDNRAEFETKYGDEVLRNNARLVSCFNIVGANELLQTSISERSTEVSIKVEPEDDDKVAVDVDFVGEELEDEGGLDAHGYINLTNKCSQERVRRATIKNFQSNLASELQLRDDSKLSRIKILNTATETVKALQIQSTLLESKLKNLKIKNITLNMKINKYLSQKKNIFHTMKNLNGSIKVISPQNSNSVKLLPPSFSERHRTNCLIETQRLSRKTSLLKPQFVSKIGQLKEKVAANEYNKQNSSKAPPTLTTLHKTNYNAALPLPQDSTLPEQDLYEYDVISNDEASDSFADEFNPSIINYVSISKEEFYNNNS